MINRDFEDRWHFLEQNDIEIRQNIEELFEVYERLQAYNLQNLVEIGAFQGGSTYILAGLLLPKDEIILIDDCTRDVTHTLIKACNFLAEEGFCVHLIDRSSQDEYTIKRVADLLNGSKAGIIHIDGSHHTKPLLADFNNYLPFLADDGFMLFHDIIGVRSARIAWKSHITNPQQTKYTRDTDKSGLAFSTVGGLGEAKWAAGIGVVHKKT